MDFIWFHVDVWFGNKFDWSTLYFNFVFFWLMYVGAYIKKYHDKYIKCVKNNFKTLFSNSGLAYSPYGLRLLILVFVAPKRSNNIQSVPRGIKIRTKCSGSRFKFRTKCSADISNQVSWLCRTKYSFPSYRSFWPLWLPVALALYWELFC